MIAYRIDVRDHKGNIVYSFSDFQSIVIERRVNHASNHALYLRGGHPVVELLRPDYIIEFWRSWPERGLGWYREYTGLHRSETIALYENGRTIASVYGRGPADFLNRRMVMYPRGSSFTTKSGPAETVIKDYVRENCGEHAGLSARIGGGYPLPGFIIEADEGRGPQWSGEFAYRSVMESIQDICAATDMRFDVAQTGNAEFMFFVRENFIGRDLTATNMNQFGVNGAGNIPHIFSPQHGNISRGTASISYTEAFNHVYVLGEGSGQERTIEHFFDPLTDGYSPWARVEQVVSNTTAEEGEDAASLAAAALFNGKPRREISFSVIQTPASTYGKDWQFGDKVTVELGGLVEQRNVDGVRMTISPDNVEDIETLEVEFRDPEEKLNGS